MFIYLQYLHFCQEDVSFNFKHRILFADSLDEATTYEAKLGMKDGQVLPKHQSKFRPT